MSLIELATELSKTSEEVIRLQSIREEALQKVEAARLILEQEEKTFNDILTLIETTNAKVESIQVQIRELVKPKETKIIKKAPTENVVLDISDRREHIRRRDRWSDSDSEDEEEDSSSRDTRYYREALKYSADKRTKDDMEWTQRKKVYDSQNTGVVGLNHTCYIPRIYIPPEEALVAIKDTLTRAGYTEHLDRMYLVKRQDFGDYASYYLNNLTRASKQYLVDKRMISYATGYMIIGVPRTSAPVPL